MDERDNTGGPAFQAYPFAYKQSSFHDHNARAVEYVTHPAMTYHQWLVGMALAGGLASDFQNNPVDEAFAIADAVIAEKAKREASNGS